MYQRALGTFAADAAVVFMGPTPAQAQAQAQAAGQAKALDAAMQAAQAKAAVTGPLMAYRAAIAKLAPSWSPLPLAPYPPSGDTSGFPRTGSPTLILNQASVSAAQLAEPGKITQALAAEQAARIPKLNVFFLIGAAAIVGYFVIRRN